MKLLLPALVPLAHSSRAFDAADRTPWAHNRFAKTPEALPAYAVVRTYPQLAINPLNSSVMQRLSGRLSRPPLNLQNP
jgi:hypothetical protein